MMQIQQQSQRRSGAKETVSTTTTTSQTLQFIAKHNTGNRSTQNTGNCSNCIIHIIHKTTKQQQLQNCSNHETAAIRQRNPNRRSAEFSCSSKAAESTAPPQQPPHSIQQLQQQ